MDKTLDSALNKLGQDLLLRSKAISTYISDGRYRELGVRDVSTGIIAILFIYTGLLVFYRLYLSPIAGFPGPKLAAATEWYEFYHQLVKNGQWGNQVQKLHDKYGKIIGAGCVAA